MLAVARRRRRRRRDPRRHPDRAVVRRLHGRQRGARADRVYALRSLRAQVIAGWALRRAFRSLGLLVPLLTAGAADAAAVHHVPVHQRRGVAGRPRRWTAACCGATVLFFGVAAVLFLVPRLARGARRLRRLDRATDDVLAGERGRPLEARRAAADRRATSTCRSEAQVTGLQMVNLVLVLVIAQAVQVLLLALAVFGVLPAVRGGGDRRRRDQVLDGRRGPSTCFGLDLGQPASCCRSRCSSAAFSGLYFTVYAITDELYRKEFFTVIMNELRRAVGARVVYRALRARAATGG